MSRSVLRVLDPVFQVDIRFDNPILEGAIEPLQLLLLGCQLCVERRAPTLDGAILVCSVRRRGVSRVCLILSTISSSSLTIFWHLAGHAGPSNVCFRG
jgi:hypothetical protein